MKLLERIQQAFSSIHHVFVIEDSDPRDLFTLLEVKLPAIDPLSWKKRASFGGIFVNGIPALENTSLPFPARIEYYEPKLPIETAHEAYAQFSPEWIVWEDRSLVICYKPNRLPTTPAKEQHQYNLKSYLERHYSSILHFPSRLDMSTQGLVIASRHPDMHGPLQRLFELREIQKRYLFFTTGCIPHLPLLVDAPIGKTELHPVLRVPHGSASKKAATLFEDFGGGSLVSQDAAPLAGSFIQATPYTGRTHQIRVHAGSISCPVAGDKFSNGAPFPMLCLLSHRLTFTHPFTEEKLDISIPQRLCPEWAQPALFN